MITWRALACAAALVSTASLAKKPELAPKAPDTFGNSVSAGAVKQWDKVAADFSRAWNEGDAEKLKGFFQADATYLSPTGEVAAGRQEISSLIQRDQQGPLKDFTSDLKVDSVRSFAPAPYGGQIVIVDLRNELKGAVASKDANPPVPTDLRVTIVGTRVGNKWLFDAVREYPDVKANVGVGGSGVGGSGPATNNSQSSAQEAPLPALLNPYQRLTEPVPFYAPDPMQP